MIDKVPILFKPYLKTVIWGGNKICKYKNIPQPEPNIGESWEISSIPGHESVVAEGKYKGLSLPQMVDKFGKELLGKKVMEKYGKNFPLLIKFIDANDDLSIQVHPDDNLAMKRHGSLGKTEMWYIVSSDSNAKIFSGLKIKMSREEFIDRIKEGNFTEAIATHHGKPGDVFFIPAGRVHSIGAGNLLAEIQESSDITYRIYDYDRKDKNGQTRELHTDLAKDAIDFNVYDNYLSSSPSETEDEAELINCEHFITNRLKIKGTKNFSLDGSSFVVLICIEGKVTINTEEGETTISAGHTALIPAAIKSLTLSGDATILSTKI